MKKYTFLVLSLCILSACGSNAPSNAVKQPDTLTAPPAASDTTYQHTLTDEQK